MPRTRLGRSPEVLDRVAVRVHVLGVNERDGPRWLPWVVGIAVVGVVAVAAFTLKSGRAVAVSTGVLVLVTTWYAWQTRQMVRAMEAARAAQVRPHLALTLELDQTAVFLRVVNAGAGPAMNVDILVVSEPGTAVRIPYMTPVLASGAGKSFVIKQVHVGSLDPAPVTDLKQIVHTLQAKVVVLTGTCTDSLGRVHEVSDSLNLEKFADAYYSRAWRAQPEDQLRRIADAVVKMARRRPDTDSGEAGST